jgi:hypothetical protein
MPPTGNRLRDGFPSTISFTTPSNISFWEKEVTPVGLDGGGPNDTTNMRNTAYRTKQPKKLKTGDDVTIKAQYDPKVLNDIVAAINVNQLLTITMPDLSLQKVWGWMDKFKPDALREGETPEATVTFVISNQDNSGAEVAPLYIGPPS